MMALALIPQWQDVSLWYPVMVNAGCLSVFAASLVKGPPVVERIAQAMEKAPLDEHAIRYTRRVTQAWCVFFLANGLIAMGTILSGRLDWWAWYNGAVSYGLIALFFGVEYAIRCRVKGRNRGH